MANLTRAVSAKLAGDAERLQHLLHRSRHALEPLQEPFDIDLGLHRWLGAAREEAYSDWLHWVIQEVKTPSGVFRLFGLPVPEALKTRDELAPEVEREVYVSYGHAGHTGRLDLVIKYLGVPRIVVEVKKAGADEADTLKHEGYAQSLTGSGASEAVPVLLATTATQDSYHGFRFVPWGKVCVELRRTAASLGKSGRLTVSALMLAFVAAVEQNLLGFNATYVQGVCAGNIPLYSSALVDHLSSFVGES